MYVCMYVCLFVCLYVVFCAVYSLVDVYTGMCFSVHINLFMCLFPPGGGLFGILGKYTNKFGKDPVVLLGMLVHFIAFYLAYANLPALSIADKVSAHDSLGAIFNPSK